ncbi:class I SAM-dependent methyltransferase [Steroidobacter cummioxidans]|uniref:class I SAM-dependent methyltransferase n=1 Tax=Steroidobacter cummioxidans TaxID=1803913 RepID=UPI000E323D7E|nr:class I SAM-dependent methyltransferase [Steroidobacter cummioxidans]
MSRALLLAVSVSLLTVAGCKKAPPPVQPPAEQAAPAATTSELSAEDKAAIHASIGSIDRLPGDTDEDSWRKPSEVLTFLEVKPGMEVVDYLSAGGYYTELLARIVGPDGQVIAYNNPEYLKFSGEKPAQRYGNDRLANVVQLTMPPEEAPFEPNTLDAALFVMSYHDLHWKAKDGSWPNTDPAQALAKLVPALKPGASVVVVDHVAAAGADPATSVDALHRIDPAIIKRDFEAAGLTFEADSKAFANAEDDHTKPVFDPAVRHKTDQVMYRFRKAL